MGKSRQQSERRREQTRRENLQKLTGFRHDASILQVWAVKHHRRGMPLTASQSALIKPCCGLLAEMEFQSSARFRLMTGGRFAT